jgi:hypothetical protein
MLYERLRNRAAWSREVEDRASYLQLQEIRELREVLKTLEYIFSEIAPIAEAQGIILAVIAEAVRGVPSLVSEVGMDNFDPEQVKESVHQHCLEVMKEVAYPRKDLDEVFDLAATIIAVGARNAIKNPSGIPTSVSSEVSQMLRDGARRIGEDKDNALVLILKPYIEDLEGVCRQWRRQGRSEIFWVTLQHLVDAMRVAG